MKITKEEFDRLYSDKITKREYDNIIEKIDERFYEIVSTMVPSLERNKGWCDYGNCNYESENSDGYFDIDDYKENTQIGGELNIPEPYDGDCNFPTRWLWEDFEEEFRKEVENFKQEKIKEKLTVKQKRENLKIRKLEFRKIIENKLTKEELKYINFK